MTDVLGRVTAALLNPRPVVLVTCCNLEGKPNVLSVAWQTPLSHEPPMLGISIDSRRYSHQLIKDVGEFAVNVVDLSFQNAVEFCGNCSGEYMNKFSAAGLSLYPARYIKPPLIAGALAHLECEVKQAIPTGSHTFFIAIVRYADVCESCFTDAWITEKGKVLLCLQRDRFATWTKEMIGMRKGYD